MDWSWKSSKIVTKTPLDFLLSSNIKNEVYRILTAFRTVSLEVLSVYESKLLLFLQPEGRRLEFLGYAE